MYLGGPAYLTEIGPYNYPTIGPSSDILRKNIPLKRYKSLIQSVMLAQAQLPS